PVVMAARKGLGPLMIVVGLALLGLWRPRFSVGHQLASRLQGRMKGSGAGGAYLLGLVFSLAFCPTLFWLFFGLTLPLALRSAGGWGFPAAFAVGTGAPLLALAGVVSLGLGTAERIAGRLARLNRGVGWAAGVVFVVAGLHDTIVYWGL